MVVRFSESHLADFLCWLVTTSGGSLWINHAAGDGRVYHVNGANFADAQPLRDAELITDRYLAHVVALSPHAFDFRRS